MLDYLLSNKPLLVGLHLVFAILAIDGFIWLFGELLARSGHRGRIMFSAVLGIVGFALSWLIGGYYYVTYYGPIVKPIIKAGTAPWAHAIAMEAKEQIFLFLIPMAVTAFFLSRLNAVELKTFGLRPRAVILLVLIAGIGLSLGLMGYIISAAARWA